MANINKEEERRLVSRRLRRTIKFSKIEVREDYVSWWKGVDQKE